MRDLDDELPAIGLGDTVAFGRWIAGAEPLLRCRLRPFAARVDAEAVLQEALLRTWQIAPRFIPDGRPNGLLRVAHRIARNLAISEARRVRTVASEDADDPAFEEDADRPERAPSDPLLRRVIATCREALPDKPAQALAARLESGGCEPDDVLAERLGMRKNTFLQNFTRARKLLKDCLESRGIDLRSELA
jgi:RNA polymerase sigma-70 factor (ECF subfamily)